MNYDNPTQLEPNKFNNKKKTDASLILKILETMKNTPPLKKNQNPIRIHVPIPKPLHD